jgi:hypothetical protein
MIIAAFIISILSLIVAFSSVVITLYDKNVIKNNVRLLIYLSQVEFWFPDNDDIINYSCGKEFLNTIDKIVVPDNEIYCSSTLEIRLLLDRLTEKLNEFCNFCRNHNSSFAWNHKSIGEVVSLIKKEIDIENSISDKGKTIIKNIFR